MQKRKLYFEFEKTDFSFRFFNLAIYGDVKYHKCYEKDWWLIKQKREKKNYEQVFTNMMHTKKATNFYQ